MQSSNKRPEENKKKQLKLNETETNFDFLFRDVVLQIFSYLSPRDLAALALVSKKFKTFSEENVLWNKFFKKFDITPDARDPSISKVQLKNLMFAPTETDALNKLIDWLVRFPTDRFYAGGFDYAQSIQAILANENSDRHLKCAVNSDVDTDDEINGQAANAPVGAPVVNSKILLHRFVAKSKNYPQGVNRTGRSNQTVLHAFAAYGDLDAVKILLQAGGNMLLEDNSKLTPLEYFIDKIYDIDFSERKSELFSLLTDIFVSCKDINIYDKLSKILDKQSGIEEPFQANLCQFIIASAYVNNCIDEKQFQDFKAWYEKGTETQFSEELVDNLKMEYESTVRANKR